MSRGARAGLLLFALVGATALFAPAIAPYDPSALALAENLREPSLRHPFGQDRLGRDVFSRVVWGARISLGVGLAVVAASVTLGTAAGLAAGLAGGWLDAIVSRVVDVLLAFPGIVLAIALAAVLGPSLENLVLALAAIGWTATARLVRAETLSLARRPHVEAARALGATRLRTVARHVLPLLVAPLVVQATFSLAGAIIAEASLSFLGLGAPPPTPSWGAMLNEGRAFLLVAPHVALFPGAAVLVTLLAVNLLGEGLRQALQRS